MKRTGLQEVFFGNFEEGKKKKEEEEKEKENTSAQRQARNKKNIEKDVRYRTNK